MNTARARTLIATTVVLSALGGLFAETASAHYDRKCRAQADLPYAEDGAIKGWGYGECSYVNHTVVCSMTTIQVQKYNGEWFSPEDQDWGEQCVPKEDHVADTASYDFCGFGSGTVTGMFRTHTRFRALNRDGVVVHEKFDTSKARVISC